WRRGLMRRRASGCCGTGFSPPACSPAWVSCSWRADWFRSPDSCRCSFSRGHFVERSFLAPVVLLTKLKQMQLGQRLAAWLAAPATAPLLARSITAMLPYLIRSLRNRDLGEFLA